MGRLSELKVRREPPPFVPFLRPLLVIFIVVDAKLGKLLGYVCRIEVFFFFYIRRDNLA